MDFRDGSRLTDFPLSQGVLAEYDPNILQKVFGPFFFGLRLPGFMLFVHKILGRNDEDIMVFATFVLWFLTELKNFTQ